MTKTARRGPADRLLLRLATEKSEIRAYLAAHLSAKSAELERVNLWGRDVVLRLQELVTNGKMLRGALVMLASDLVGRTRDGEEVKIAAVLELIQSSLLVHDDIMDRDEVRRGRETIHAQYRRLAQSHALPDPEHFGEAMAICAGDVAIFTAFEILGGLRTEPERHTAILSLLAREMCSVGVAQMHDLYIGRSSGNVSESEVYRLYLYKTGRYTFSLPLILGATLAGEQGATVERFSRLGELLGVLFQIKDDEIGLFGRTTRTGKPIGTDVREGKKTLFHLRLLDSAPAQELERALAVLGNPFATTRDISYIRGLVVRLGIRERLAAEMARIAEEAHRLADGLEGAVPYALEAMHDFIDYNLTRTA